MKSKIYQIRLKGIDEEIINKGRERGYEVSDLIRTALRFWAKENENLLFPPLYAQVQKERLDLKLEKVNKQKEFEEMTPEDYATNILKARYHNGIVYFMPNHDVNNFYIRQYPLATIKDINPQNHRYPEVHLAVLDNQRLYYDTLNPYTGHERKVVDNQAVINKYNEIVDDIIAGKRDESGKLIETNPNTPDPIPTPTQNNPPESIIEPQNPATTPNTPNSAPFSPLSATETQNSQTPTEPTTNVLTPLEEMLAKEFNIPIEEVRNID